MTGKRSLLAAAIVLSVPAAPAFAASFDGIISFGDSLSDVGNVYLATGGAEPAPPYFDGRFSNGEIWLDYLATDLGVAAPKPSLAGGNDYAYGDATTGYSNTENKDVPDLITQVSQFTTATHGHAPSNALYTLSIGANDLSNIMTAFFGGAISIQTAEDYVAGAAATVAQEAAILEGEGAKDLLWFEVPDLGVTPKVTANGYLAIVVASDLSALFDAQVAADLKPVEAAGLTVKTLGAYALLDEVVAHPHAYGFTNGADPCYVGPLTGGGSVCSNPAGYVFWDDEHPTTAAGKMLAANAAALVPEPSSWAMTAVGFAALGLVGLRARRGVAAARGPTGDA